MTSLESALRQIHADLTAIGARFALVGGLAVSARTEPRFTRDADLVVAAADDGEAEVVVHALTRRGYGISAVVEQDAAKRLATVRLTRGGAPHGPVVDLLFASSGIEREVVAAAEPLELLSGLTIPVARIGHLIALKVLSRDDTARPQDIVDLRALLRTASDADVGQARAAVTLIGSRGYHRGRDLEAELNALIGSSR